MSGEASTAETPLERLRKMVRASELRLWQRIAAARDSGYEADPPSSEEVDRHRRLLVAIQGMEAFEEAASLTREPDARPEA